MKTQKKRLLIKKIISILLILIIYILSTSPMIIAAGDIASGTSETCSWVIDGDGNLTVRPTTGTEGTLANMPGNNTGSPWYQYREQIKTVKFEGKVYTGASARALFEGMTNCTSINTANLDTSKTTTMFRMFYGCSSLQSLDLSNFNTSKVTTTENMFYNCSSLTSLNVSNFDTSQVITMAYMFRGCSSLKSLNISNFDTSKVTTMAYMFQNCSSLTSLNLSHFDTAQVTIMQSMFDTCRSLKELDISSFDTTSVENAWVMFGNGEVQLEKIKLGSNTKLYGNQPIGDAFGRGTWKRQEDNNTYSAVELSANPVAGTYVKISNISKDFKVDFPVTYKIGNIDKIDSFTTTRPDIFRMIDDDRVVADVNVPSTTEYTLPGQIKVKFIDVVEDRFGNKYDFQLTIENVTYYDLDQVNEGNAIGNAVSSILRLQNGVYHSHVGLYEDDNAVKNNDLISRFSKDICKI